ncbi:MAG: hypothetical protein HYY03_06080 [Chloroflexi bacterium]|nr:hypothetical protein [Chloroflexota bacterium]
MGVLSFFRRGRLDPAAKAALLAYLKAEVELAVVQTKGSEEYNRAVAAMLASAPDAPEQDAAIRNLVEATSQYLELLNSIATSHTLTQAPPEAAEAFLAHELLYRSYVHWCENRLLTLSSAGYLTKAQLALVSAGDKAFMRDKKAADRAKGKLLRTIGVTPHDLIAMMQEAMSGPGAPPS